MVCLSSVEATFSKELNKFYFFTSNSSVLIVVVGFSLVFLSPIIIFLFHDGLLRVLLKCLHSKQLILSAHFSRISDISRKRSMDTSPTEKRKKPTLRRQRSIVTHPNDSLISVKLWEDRFVLSLKQTVWKNLRQHCVDEPNALHTSVSFIGKTQNGKSFLIREMLKHLDSTSRMPNIMKKMQLTATSAGVTCYRTQHSNSDTDYWNDYEGEDGGVPEDDKDIMSDVTPSLSAQVLEARRRLKLICDVLLMLPPTLLFISLVVRLPTQRQVLKILQILP